MPLDNDVELKDSVMLRNVEGEVLTPSVVHFDGDEIVVGKAAKRAAATDAEHVAECAKRDMGLESYSKPINGQNIPPEVIQACILRKLGRDFGNTVRPDARVVITVPAYFDEPRRKATQLVGAFNGFGGLASALVACAEYFRTPDPTTMAVDTSVTIGLGVLTGNIFAALGALAGGNCADSRLRRRQQLGRPGLRPG